MNGLINFKTGITMTSLDIAEITGKRHADVMRDIRNEIESLGEEIGLSIFAQSTYINSQGKTQPCFEFGRKGAMQLAMKYDAITRFKVIEHLDELEQKLINPASLTKLEILNMAVESEEKCLRLEAENAEMKPKAVFADAITVSKDTISVGLMATQLSQAGIPNMGRNRLFSILREDGFLLIQGKDWNKPSQRSVELGIIENEEGVVIRNGDKADILTNTPRITTKGQKYFMEYFANRKELVYA